MKRKIVFVILAIVILLVSYIILNHEWVNLKILTNKNHVLMAYDYDGAFSVSIGTYPNRPVLYTNITEDGIIYRYCDNGYIIEDMWKFSYLGGNKITKSQITQILSEVETLEEVTTKELLSYSSSERKYTKVMINENSKVVYTKEFEKIIEAYI